MGPRPTRVFAILASAAVAGIALFGLMAWRSVEVERAEPDEALRRFITVRSQFSGTEAILRAQADGRIVRSKEPPAERQPPKLFRVLAYRVTERRLVQVNVPFWFLRAKGPAIKYFLRGTGLDMDRLG